jgi:hypothetical protein
MDSVKVTLLKYDFRFRVLSWREEADIPADPKRDRRRSLLASALFEVSGLRMKSVEEADRVLAAVPPAILARVFILWRGGHTPRKFFTQGLYRAPDPAKQVVANPPSDAPIPQGVPISPEELAAMKASGMRGATRASSVYPQTDSVKAKKRPN